MPSTVRTRFSSAISSGLRSGFTCELPSEDSPWTLARVFSAWLQQWRASLFAGIVFVLVGLCYVAVAQSAPLLTVPLHRKYTSQTVEWPKSECRISAVRFTAANASLHLHQFKVFFTSGRSQLLNRFGAVQFKGTQTDWYRLDRDLKTSGPQCIDHIEVTARSITTIWPDASLQVDVQ